MRTRLSALLSLCLLLVVLLPGQALAVDMRLRTLSPASTRIVERALPSGANGPALPGKVGLAGELDPAALSLASVQPQIPLELEAGYYWSGGDLIVDGFVSNDSEYTLNYTQIWYQVWNGDIKYADGGLYASAHTLQPGEWATFDKVFPIPGLAGEEMDVYLYAFGYQETLPTPVELTELSRDMSVSGGVRTYTCVYQNDSDVTVHTPILAGVEEDDNGWTIDMLHDREDVSIPAGAVWTAQGVGHYPDVVPADVYTWATALPVVTHNTVYRFRNLHNGFYLWTSDVYERNTIVRELKSTWVLEGSAYRTRITTNNAPLWRFRNKVGGFYLYSGDASEKANIIATLGDTWTYEGPTFKVSMDRLGSPVWRFRNLQDGTYLYSADVNEKNTIVATLGQTWLLEGPAYYLAP